MLLENWMLDYLMGDIDRHSGNWQAVCHDYHGREVTDSTHRHFTVTPKALNLTAPRNETWSDYEGNLIWQPHCRLISLDHGMAFLDHKDPFRQKQEAIWKQELASWNRTTMMEILQWKEWLQHPRDTMTAIKRSLSCEPLSVFFPLRASTITSQLAHRIRHLCQVRPRSYFLPSRPRHT